MADVEMVERVARAIYASRNGPGAKPPALCLIDAMLECGARHAQRFRRCPLAAKPGHGVGRLLAGFVCKARLCHQGLPPFTNSTRLA